MGNQGGIDTYQDFAKKLTMEYDMCMRRGYQSINNVIIQKGNTELMETMIILACNIALQKQEGLHGVINDIGKAVVGYWTGATLNNFPPPVIPAVGSFQNLLTVSAMVTNPGKFPDMGKQVPTTDSGVFLDMLILAMTIHLTTVTGMYMTTSLYPGVPVTIAPGILLWTGYNVPPSTPSVPKVDVVVLPPQEIETVEALLKSIPDDNNTVEAVGPVAASTGKNIISDDGEVPSPALQALQSKLPNDVPEFETTTETVDADITETTKNNVPIECGDGFTYEDNLSANIKVRTLTLDTTWPHKLKNQGGLTKEEIVCNLRNLSINVIEPILAKTFANSFRN